MFSPFSTWGSTFWLVQKQFESMFIKFQAWWNHHFVQMFPWWNPGEPRFPEIFQGRLRAKHHEGGPGRRGDYLQREGGLIFWGIHGKNQWLAIDTSVTWIGENRERYGVFLIKPTHIHSFWLLLVKSVNCATFVALNILFLPVLR